MATLNSFSMSTGSETYTGVTTETSLNDEFSSSSTTASTTIQTSSPDDSDGLAAEVGGSAIAVGDDTYAGGSIYGELSDNGAVTSVDLSTTMVAASEDSETADAWTDTFAGVSDGTEVLFSSTVNTQNSELDATGSTATSTSTTNLSAYDIQLEPESTTTVPAAEEEFSGTIEQLESAPAPADGEDVGDIGSNWDIADDWDIDGSIAVMEFEALAIGDDTLVSVDASVLAIEDELSVAEGFVVLGVE